MSQCHSRRQSVSHSVTAVSRRRRRRRRRRRQVSRQKQPNQPRHRE